MVVPDADREFFAVHFAITPVAFTEAPPLKVNSEKSVYPRRSPDLNALNFYTPPSQVSGLSLVQVIAGFLVAPISYLTG